MSEEVLQVRSVGGVQMQGWSCIREPAEETLGEHNAETQHCRDRPHWQAAAPGHRGSLRPNGLEVQQQLGSLAPWRRRGYGPASK